MRTPWPRRLAILGALLASVALVAPVTSGTPLSDLNASKGFRKGVTVAGIQQHLNAFQAIADANLFDGVPTRESGTAGYLASVDYVVARLEAAGYDPVLQEFEFPFFKNLAAAEFDRVSPDPRVYVEGGSAEFAVMTYSGSGDVTAEAIHVVDTGGAAPGAGCEAGDFGAGVAGRIAVIQRGLCTFKIKATNALAAGAVAVVIYNNTTPNDPLNGTLGTPGQNAPVIGTTLAIGQEIATLLTGGPVILHVMTSTESDVRTTWNVIADTATGDPNRTVVIGAHLDSRLEGPGINDNGSGSATILEIAETFAGQNRVAANRLRFMWYAAEEFNLLGSTAYVASLSAEELDQIMAMINLDMVSSPNYARFVYDGDNSAFPVGPGAAAGPPGSGYLEDLFTDYFVGAGLSSDETPFSGRSDYGPFIAQGIPAGGLFTGAEGIKTAEQAAEFGGTAGVAFDACYHQLCDDIDNVNSTALDQMSDAAAHIVLTLSKVKFDITVQ